jgi:hypothetical protein
MTTAGDFARGVNPNYSDDSIRGLDNQVRHLATFVCDNPVKPAVPDITRIMAYEQGELDDEQTITLFQELINCGLAWQLQGHYGRAARAMIDAGVCVPCPN